MKKTLLFALLLLILSGCTPPKARLSYGKIIPYKNAVVLPMAKQPGSMDADWCIELLFDEDQVVLRSPEMLHTCYISIAYEIPGTDKKDVADMDLDFYDQMGGQFVYTLPYSWFPSRDKVENVIQIAVFYGPESVGLPTRSVETEDGTITYPDYSGYSFIFNRKESLKYFKAFIEHLR